MRLLVTELDPEAVLCTGDLTHRNRAAEHDRAAAFLRSLRRPLLAVPGNHDLPPLPPARLATPFTAFQRLWEDLEPSYVSPTLAVCALNSVRPLRYQRGALGIDQLEHAAKVLRSAPAGALRVVGLHHHLVGAPWRTGKRAIPRRTAALAALAEAGAELVVGGHTHQGVVVASAEFLDGARGSGVVLATVAGLGRPRPGRHAEACGVNAYRVEDGTIVVSTHTWDGGGFRRAAERRFARALPPAGS